MFEFKYRFYLKQSIPQGCQDHMEVPRITQHISTIKKDTKEIEWFWITVNTRAAHDYLLSMPVNMLS